MVAKIKNKKSILQKLLDAPDIKKIQKEMSKTILEQLKLTSKLEVFQIAEDQTALQVMKKVADRMALEMVTNNLTSEMSTIAIVKDAGRDPNMYKGLNRFQALKLMKEEDLLDASKLPENVKKEIFIQKRLELLKERNKLLSDDLAVTIRTEATIMDARESKFTEKRNVNSGDIAVCQVCRDATSEGWIPIEDEFDNGHLSPSLHSHCRCVLEFR